jgi:hypothetical protein
MDDHLDEFEETVFLDNVTIITTEAPPQEGPPSPSTDHRVGRRKQVTRRTQTSVRRGTLGLGRELGCGLVDVAEDGLGIRLKEFVPVGQEVTIELSAPGISKPHRLVAEIRWCRQDKDGTYRAGVRLRRRLPYSTLTDLAR